MSTELAIADDGAWRISLADITVDGPFSVFPGRHRLLTVVDGPVLGLEVDARAMRSSRIGRCTLAVITLQRT